MKDSVWSYIIFFCTSHAYIIAGLIQSSPVIWVEQGNDTILYCNLGGTEESFDWTRGQNYTASTQNLLAYNNGGVIRGQCLTQGKCQLLGRDLKLKEVQISDEDTYYCGTPKSYTSLKLNVTIEPSAPTINHCSDNKCAIIFPVGLSLYLTCVIRGSRPVADLAWSNSTHKVTNVTKTSVYINQDGTFDTVSFLHVRHNAPTVYTCEAHGPSIRQPWKSRATINVTEAINPDKIDKLQPMSKHPEIDYCGLQQNCSLTWPTGTPLQLTCTLRGAQYPLQLFWFHTQYDLSKNMTNEVHPGTNGALTYVAMVTLHVSRSSSYYCIVGNDAGLFGDHKPSVIRITSTDVFQLDSYNENINKDGWSISTIILVSSVLLLILLISLLIMYIFLKPKICCQRVATDDGKDPIFRGIMKQAYLIRNLWTKKVRMHHHHNLLEEYLTKNLIPKGLKLKFNLAIGSTDQKLLQDCQQHLTVASTGILKEIIKFTEAKAAILTADLNRERQNLFQKEERSMAVSIWQSAKQRAANLQTFLERKHLKKLKRDQMTTEGEPAQPVPGNPTKKRKRRFDRSLRRVRKKRKSTNNFCIKPTVNNKHEPINLSQHSCSESEISLLSKGPSFCPTPKDVNWMKLRDDLNSFARRLRLHVYFNKDSNSVSEAEETTLPSLHQQLKITSKWQPPKSKDPALENFISAVCEDLLDPKATRKVKDNLSKEERLALNKLKHNSEIAIATQDKGGKFVLMDTSNPMELQGNNGGKVGNKVQDPYRETDPMMEQDKPISQETIQEGSLAEDEPEENHPLFPGEIVSKDPDEVDLGQTPERVKEFSAVHQPTDNGTPESSNGQMSQIRGAGDGGVGTQYRISSPATYPVTKGEKSADYSSESTSSATFEEAIIEKLSSPKVKGHLITPKRIRDKLCSCNFSLEDQASDILLTFSMKGYGLGLSFVPYLGQQCDVGYMIYFKENGEIIFRKHGMDIDLSGGKNRYDPSKKSTFLLNTASKTVLLIQKDNSSKKPLLQYTPVQTDLCSYLVIDAYQHSNFNMVLFPVQ